MSTAGIASIALFAPVVASNAVFSARRASRGIDAAEENPLFAIANFDIAGGQILKGGRAAKALAIAADPTLQSMEFGATEAIKDASKTSKLLKGAGKVLSFTADHINPIIVGAGAIKVLGSDDKLDTAARESTSLLCMFGAERAAKEFIGMPVIDKVNGKVVANHKDGLYKKLFGKEQMKAMEQYAATKKGVKMAIGGAKGLFFVGASIAGYKLGSKIAESILGEEKKAN